MRTLPGVAAAAAGQALPLTGLRTSAGLRVEGREVAPNESLDTCWRLVSPAWHAALGVPLLRGRGFEPGDTHAAPAVALVNATLARQVFADADPIGRRIATGLDGPPGAWVTIVGVVADTPQENVAKATRPEMYRPLAQDVRMNPSGLSLVVRASGDPDVPDPGPAPRDRGRSQRRRGVSRRAARRSRPRHAGRAEGGGARAAALRGLALLLAALGLYGVVSCLVGESTRELGVRLALGAEPRSLVALVLRRSLALAGLGLAIGLAAALALGRLVAGLLFGISPRDPLTLGLVALVLLSAAAAAAFGPARRAGRLDPARVLRAD